MNAMNHGYRFHPLAVDADSPEPWRALDRAVARWVLIHGGRRCWQRSPAGPAWPKATATARCR